MGLNARTVALVAGADTGPGRQVARSLAERGAHVLLGAPDGGRAAARALDGLDVRPLLLDPADAAAVRAAADALAAAYGRLDALVNAGFADLPPEVRVISVFRVTRAMLPLLLRSRAGRVVNPAAVAPDGPPTPVGAALDALTLHCANALRGTNVKVNAVAAGGAPVAVRLATLAPDGPTGEAHGPDGTVPWPP
ncbi:SDR family NAD(P)-dependent oxidoreductase [Actinomadura atramentaria]|uniref:SDR family NAD(P)-dependent oxidoreductase n=1 Tax=Actinomadura atramentaria TaxID=1990 RepID=UPI000373BEE5|nr:SDR family NAD(P)-dependent oxidoreductase [Actinomadura atramentaria]